MDINGQLSKNGWVKGAETAKYYTYYKNIDDTNIKAVEVVLTLLILMKQVYPLMFTSMTPNISTLSLHHKSILYFVLNWKN